MNALHKINSREQSPVANFTEASSIWHSLYRLPQNWVAYETDETPLVNYFLCFFGEPVQWETLLMISRAVGGHVCHIKTQSLKKPTILRQTTIQDSRCKSICSIMYRHQSYKLTEQCENKSNISCWVHVLRPSLTPYGRYHWSHQKTFVSTMCIVVSKHDNNNKTLIPKEQMEAFITIDGFEQDCSISRPLYTWFVG